MCSRFASFVKPTSMCDQNGPETEQTVPSDESKTQKCPPNPQLRTGHAIAFNFLITAKFLN